MPRVNVFQIAARRLKLHAEKKKRRGYQKVDNPAQIMPCLDFDFQTTGCHPRDECATDVLPELTHAERHLFKLIARGVLSDLQKFMSKHPDLNINCQDYKGQTPIIYAIKRNDEEIMEYMFKFQELFPADAILHAVQVGNIYAVESVLDFMGVCSSELSKPGFINSIYFSPDITPLILAAHCQHYAVVKMLLKRGHTIIDPHPPRCFCKSKCLWKHQGETLNATHARYHAYQALASPAYICQSREDPILTAFNLSRELYRCSKYERELQIQYKQLAKDVSQFAIDLLNQCRTTEEVLLLLNKEKALVTRRFLNDDDEPFPRIKDAINCKQKKFIAHPNAQHVLRQRWLGSCQQWRSISKFELILRLLPQLAMFPCMLGLYIVYPNSQHRYMKIWKTPMNKFARYMLSYIIFLIILFTHNELDAQSYVRGPPDTGLEWVIIMYVTSFMWLGISNALKLGVRKHFDEKWHRFDFFMVLWFYLSFLTWGWAALDVYWYGNRNQKRRFWDQYDPTLIAEALYAVATITAFFKLLYFFQIGSRIGPLQMSISKMFDDIINFLMVFLLVLISFATGIHKLYGYYKGEVLTVDGKEITQNEAFVTMQSTINTLFWALFGYSPYQFTEVILAQEVNIVNGDEVVKIRTHKLTEFVGLFMYGIYNVIAIIILVNLIIAMMSISFIRVQENADEEWKFARTTVWMLFFREETNLPPPFNIIPTPRSTMRFLHMLCGNCLLGRSNLEEATRHKYKELMRSLVQRYLVYAHQMQVRERTLYESDLQYLLPGIPAAHMMPPRLQTSSEEEDEPEESKIYKTRPQKSKSTPFTTVPTSPGAPTGGRFNPYQNLDTPQDESSV